MVPMPERFARVCVVMCGCLLLSACIGQGSWGQGKWPDGKRFAEAARIAATDPYTWVPVAGAALLQIDNVDERWSRDLAEDQPLFGSDAESVSDDLRNVSTAAYFLTALAAPSEDLGDKTRGLAVGVGTMILDGVASQAGKDLAKRERPDGSNTQSLPSGHASKAASRTNMAIMNLQHIDMRPWQRNGLTWMLRGVALGTGLARVEAEKHHISDILVGLGLGQFVSRFMYEAFLVEHHPGVEISFMPVAEGGALTVTIPLRH